MRGGAPTSHAAPAHNTCHSFLRFDDMPLLGYYIGHGESPIIFPSSSSEETSVDKWRSVPWLMHNFILSHSPLAPSHTVNSHSEDGAPIDVPRCVGYVSTWMRGLAPLFRRPLPAGLHYDAPGPSLGATVGILGIGSQSRRKRMCCRPARTAL